MAARVDLPFQLADSLPGAASAWCGEPTAARPTPSAAPPPISSRRLDRADREVGFVGGVGRVVRAVSGHDESILPYAPTSVGALSEAPR